MSGAAATLLTIGGIFAFAALVAAMDEAWERWSNRRAVRRAAERRATRRDAWAAVDEAVNYDRTFAPSGRVW